MFEKMRDFYKRNRVYSILMIVSIMCVIAIGVGVLLYFFGQTSKDKYGSRLETIENSKFSSERVEIIKTGISENELVESVDINIKGKLIYIDILLKSGKHTDAEAIAQASFEAFSEEEKKLYDLQYIISSNDVETKENFPIMGYVKSGSMNIRWTNYVTVGE